MNPSQTAAIYDKIAQHWDNPDFDHSNGVAQHDRALGFVSTIGAALDVGCGSNGRIVSMLLQRGFEVEALDLSPEMLRRASLHNPGVTYHHADICTWEFHKLFDFISAWDSIWHVPLEAQIAVGRLALSEVFRRERADELGDLKRHQAEFQHQQLGRRAEI